MRESMDDERIRARALYMADRRRWSRLVRWSAGTAGLITTVSLLLTLLGVVSFASFQVGLLVIGLTVIAGTFLVAVIAFNLGVPRRIRELDTAFSIQTDLDLVIVNLLEPLSDDSGDSTEQRIARITSAIEAVDQQVVQARALGATSTEIEVYLEMEIEEVPGYADCEPQVIWPVLDYLERLRRTESVPGDAG